jgi:hypothetical protein
MNIKFDRRKSLGPLTLIAGAVIAWKYRFQIQEGLESVGIKTPWLKDGLDDVVRSGGAKIKGAMTRGRLKSNLDSGASARSV